LGGEVSFYEVFLHRKGGFDGKVHQIARFIHQKGCSVDKHRAKQKRCTSDKGSLVRLCVISKGLRELAGAVADHDRNLYWLVAVFLCEGGLCLCDEGVVEFGLDEVDGAAAEAAAHDT